jgi:hypothetical protein
MGCLLTRLLTPLVAAGLLLSSVAAPALAQMPPIGTGSDDGRGAQEERSTENGSGAAAEDEGHEAGSMCSAGSILEAITGGIDSLVGMILGCGFEITFEKVVVRGNEELGDSLADAAFALPAPDKGGKLVGYYERLVDKVKPALVVGVLLLGLGMMLQSANYNTNYAVLQGLPRLVFVALALAFFPQFIGMVSELSGGLAVSFMDEAHVGGALRDMVAASAVPGLSVLGVLGQILMLLSGLLVLIVAIARNMIFSVLYLLGPLALIAYPIPGVSGITASWFRGVIACFAISVIYCVEATIGSWIVDAPELVFGKGAGVSPVFNVLAMVLLFWIMWKTPFKVLEWAFQGYYAPGSGFGGLMSGVAKSFVKKEAVSALSSAAHMFFGGAAKSRTSSETKTGRKPQAIGGRTVNDKGGPAAKGASSRGGRASSADAARPYAPADPRSAHAVRGADDQKDRVSRAIEAFDGEPRAEAREAAADVREEQRRGATAQRDVSGRAARLETPARVSQTAAEKTTDARPEHHGAQTPAPAAAGFIAASSASSAALGLSRAALGAQQSGNRGLAADRYVQAGERFAEAAEHHRGVGQEYVRAAASRSGAARTASLRAAELNFRAAEANSTAARANRAHATYQAGLQASAEAVARQAAPGGPPAGSSLPGQPSSPEGAQPGGAKGPGASVVPVVPAFTRGGSTGGGYARGASPSPAHPDPDFGYRWSPSRSSQPHNPARRFYEERRRTPSANPRGDGKNDGDLHSGLSDGNKRDGDPHTPQQAPMVRIDKLPGRRPSGGKD